jgi:threonine/homoserine/homoserine lactone efflux protein
MTLTTWLSLVAICCAGAMSPGPSLAVVVRHTISSGRTHGVVTALFHGAGVAAWAMATIFGLAILVAESPLLYKFITYAGACYLAWLGIKAIRSKGGEQLHFGKAKASLPDAARDGMMISILNPKLAIFFIALFSQFVSTSLTLEDQLVMIATAGIIDSLWYSLVALALSSSLIFDTMQRKSVAIDRASGVILIGLSLRIVTL